MDAKLLLAVSSVLLLQLISPITPQEAARGVHIGKDVTVGQQPGYNNNGYQGSGPGVHIGKEVTVGQQPYQPGYQQPYQNQYQPAGTYGGQYHNGNNSPPPTSTHPQLGPCVNNGFRCNNNTDCCSNACDSYNNNFCCIPEGKICDRSRPERTDNYACCYPLQCLRYMDTGYTVCQEVNYPKTGGQRK